MNIYDLARNSSITVGAIGTILLTSSMLPVYNMNSLSAVPVMQEVRYLEKNTTPCLYNISKKTILDEAIGLFGEVRGFTKEESKLYEESLAEIFIPTGINFFEL